MYQKQRKKQNDINCPQTMAHPAEHLHLTVRPGPSAEDTLLLHITNHQGAEKINKVFNHMHHL
jgi:hypothetical protein